MLKRAVRLAEVSILRGGQNPADFVRPPESLPVALRESSIVSLANYGVLDADQVAAAFEFRNAWEAYQRVRRRDPLLERIDHGLTDPAEARRSADAKRKIKRCRDLLGRHGFELVAKVCGDGFHIRDLYRTRRERDTATDVLRIHLSALAGLWKGP